MTTCILKRDRDAVWLESLLTTSDASGVIVLLGGNNCTIAVPTFLLLAASPLVRKMLSVTDHLPPAYSPVYLSIPDATLGVLEVFRDILVKGTTAPVTDEKVRDVRQTFQMLMVDVSLVCCQSNSIDVGKAFDKDIKVEDHEGSEVNYINIDQDELEISIKIKEENYDAGTDTRAANSENTIISEEKVTGNPSENRDYLKEFKVYREGNGQLEGSASFQVFDSFLEEDKGSRKEVNGLGLFSHTHSDLKYKGAYGSLSKGSISPRKNPAPQYSKTRVSGGSDGNKGHVVESCHRRASLSRIDCNYCDAKLLPSYYLKHCRRFHPQILKDSQKLSCPVCCVKTDQKQLHKHVQEQHIMSTSSRNEKTDKMSKAVVKCDYCDLKISSNTYRRHLDVQHSLVTITRKHGKGPTAVKCDRCDENISYLNLSRHYQKVHAFFELIKCGICGKKISHVKLKYHLKFAHGQT